MISKTKGPLVLNVAHKMTSTTIKKLVRDLRALEAMLPGDALKLAYTAPDGTRPSVSKYSINADDKGRVVWTWNTTLSYEIERGAITSVPDQFILAMSIALENQKAKQDNEKIIAAKKALAGLTEAERKRVLDSVSKPKKPRDPAQKMLNKLIDGKQPPLPKDGQPKTRLVKSREKVRSNEKPTPAQVRKAQKVADEAA